MDAHGMAIAIESYWRKKGSPQVKAWVETKVETIPSVERNRGKMRTIERRARVHVIRTNLVNGLPPR